MLKKALCSSVLYCAYKKFCYKLPVKRINLLAPIRQPDKAFTAPLLEAHVATTNKIVVVKHRKRTKKVISFEDVRVAARAGNASFQRFVVTGYPSVAK